MEKEMSDFRQYKDEEANQGANGAERLKYSGWRILAGIAGLVQMVILLNLINLFSSILFVFIGALLLYAALEVYSETPLCQSEPISNTDEFPTTAMEHKVTPEEVPPILDAAMEPPTPEEILESSGVNNSGEKQEFVDRRILFCVFVFNVVLSLVQSWRGSELLAACWKWQDPSKTLTFLSAWRRSAVNYRNYAYGLLCSTALFARDDFGTTLLFIVATLVMTITLIAMLAIGYWFQVNNVVKGQGKRGDVDEDY